MPRLIEEFLKICEPSNLLVDLWHAGAASRFCQGEFLKYLINHMDTHRRVTYLSSHITWMCGYVRELQPRPQIQL